MEWALMPLKRYAEFKGRSRRKEYWMFFLFVVAASIVLGLLGTLLGLGMMDRGDGGPMMAAMFSPLVILFALAIFIPSLAVQIRRFHDQDKSGWFVLLNLIPWVGGLVVLVFMCLDGTPGPNRFGEDPKAGERGIS